MINKTIFFTAGIALLISGRAGAQSSIPSFRERTELIHKNIYSQFYNSSVGLYLETNSRKNDRPYSFLWPVCALIQAANEMEEINQTSDYMAPVVKAIGQYYTTEPPAPGYQALPATYEKDARFYDDNQWIAIAYLDAYKRSRKPVYLYQAKEIYRFMMTGFDNAAGGGLYWKEGDNTTKNTCSNGPGVLIALQLYNITGEKEYLDTALMLYNWTKKHLQDTDGLYFDAVKIPSLRIDSTKYTYNTGTMLESAVLLYNITKDQSYLNEAQKMAQAARAHFYKDGRLPGHYWFNAVMLRGFVSLYHVTQDRSLIGFFKEDADRIWREERDEQNLLGRRKVKSLIDQAGMLEIYARLALLNF